MEERNLSLSCRDWILKSEVKWVALNAGLKQLPGPRKSCCFSSPRIKSPRESQPAATGHVLCTDLSGQLPPRCQHICPARAQSPHLNSMSASLLRSLSGRVPAHTCPCSAHPSPFRPSHLPCSLSSQSPLALASSLPRPSASPHRLLE